MTDGADLALVVRRRIRASAEVLFDAWTSPEHLQRWWGPPGTRCHGVQIELRVGGSYQIGNRFSDGRDVWIRGTFERIERPSLLVYSWQVSPGELRRERVTVRFEQDVEETEVVIIHERIAKESERESHRVGWVGCLNGLIAFMT